MARDILSQADRLVVFGFGFNSYDRVLLELLTTAGRKVREVLLVDVASWLIGARAQEADDPDGDRGSRVTWPPDRPAAGVAAIPPSRG